MSYHCLDWRRPFLHRYQGCMSGWCSLREGTMEQCPASANGSRNWMRSVRWKAGDCTTSDGRRRPAWLDLAFHRMWLSAFSITPAELSVVLPAFTIGSAICRKCVMRSIDGRISLCHLSTSNWPITKLRHRETRRDKARRDKTSLPPGGTYANSRRLNDRSLFSFRQGCGGCPRVMAEERQRALTHGLRSETEREAKGAEL